MSEPRMIASAAKTYSVVIRTGRHAGAAVELADGRYLVGGGSDVDIVLTDAGIAPNHAEIKLTNGLCRLRPIGGDVAVDGRALNAGVTADIHLPAEITMSGVRLGFASVHDVSRTRSLRRFPRVAVGFAGVAAVVAVVGGIVLDGLPAVGHGFQEVTKTIGISTLVPSTVAAAPNAPSGEAVGSVPEPAVAVAALSKRLRESGLVGLIMVGVSGGMIEARGSIRPENERDWTEVQAWFDATYKGRIPILARVKVDEGAASVPRLTIRGIWSGADAYLITGDGERYGEGAKLPGGWAIERIERDRIIVSRLGERVSLVP